VAYGTKARLPLLAVATLLPARCGVLGLAAGYLVILLYHCRIAKESRPTRSSGQRRPQIGRAEGEQGEGLAGVVSVVGLFLRFSSPFDDEQHDPE